jgi:sulfoxide reductase heme-binding subunit YedZ
MMVMERVQPKSPAGRSARNRFALTVKLPLFVLAALPALSLAWRLLDGTLANPYQTVIRETGWWSLRLLVVGLALTPLSLVGGLGPAIRLRRMVGLFAAFYAALHLVAWARDYGFAWSFLWDEIVARRYLTIGFIAALALVPLAMTSARAAVRRLGGRRWRWLHRLVHVAVLGGLVHTLMAGRLGFVDVIGYGSALAFLLGWRVARTWPLRGSNS